MDVPMSAVGDGAMGFWSALDEIYPDTRHQCCWVHKSKNMLNALPNWSQPNAKQNLHQIQMARTREQAQRAFDRFVQMYKNMSPKAVAVL